MCYLCYGPASSCKVYLAKTPGTVLQPRIIFTTIDPSASETNIQQSGVEMQMVRISTSTMDSPSSNDPMVFPECHPEYSDEQHKAPTAAPSSTRKPAEREEAVWKYNMRAHWNDRHPNTPMPSGLLAAIALSAGEISLLRQGRGFAVKATRR